MFPRTAVIDRKMFTIDRKISSPCTSAVNTAEQDSTTIVFWFSPSVKFFSVILSAMQLRAKECYINIPIWGSPQLFYLLLSKLILTKCAVFTLFITCLRWRTLEVPFTIAWSLTDAYIAWTLKSQCSILKKQYLRESVIFGPQLFYLTELMTDSFNNNVTVLSV